MKTPLLAFDAAREVAVVASNRVRTHAVFAAFREGFTLSEIVTDYSVTPDELEAAIRYEVSRPAVKRRLKAQMETI